MEVKGVCFKRPASVLFTEGKVMTEIEMKSKATFNYIRYEIQKLAKQFNLTNEQIEQLEKSIKNKLEIA